MANVKDPSKKPATPAKAEPSKEPLVSHEPVGRSDPRPRQQVAYEGDDEFSIMSLAAPRRKKPAVDLAPAAPDSATPLKQKAVSTEKKEGEAPKENKWTFLRKIFGD